MSDFKAKMHQNRFRLGLCLRPRWGSLQRSPRLDLRGPTSKGRGEEGALDLSASSFWQSWLRAGIYTAAVAPTVTSHLLYSPYKWANCCVTTDGSECPTVKVEPSVSSLLSTINIPQTTDWDYRHGIFTFRYWIWCSITGISDTILTPLLNSWTSRKETA